MCTLNISHICIWHIFGSNTSSRSCIRLCFGIYMQNCLVYIPTLQCGSKFCSVLYVNIFTVLLFEWFVPVTSYVAHIYIYIHKCPKNACYVLQIYMAYMPDLVGIFVFGIYLEITCEIEVAFGCGLEHICQILGCICTYSMLDV